MTDTEKIHLLLVDDEEKFLNALTERLKLKFFDITPVTNGEDAIKVARNARFDVAVVDLKMPGMDGVETQRKLKEIQPFLQCIVLTGHGSIDSALESGQEDAFNYLLKPVDHDKLVAAIKDAYKKKVDVQDKKFKEQVEELYASGLGAHGIRKAIGELRKIYGID